MPECSSSTSMITSSIGSSRLPVAGSVLNTTLRARDGELEALAAHGLDQDAELQLAAARHLVGVLLSACSVTRMATLRSASLSSRSRMTRLCTLSPSWPANGPSLMRNIMASVGGSIGWARNGVSTAGSHSVSATVAWVMPAMATMSPASARSTAGALQAAEGQHLGDARGLDQRAVAAAWP